ncbi:MAG: prephenate dehydratase [Planctomycetia bacterium]|nr:prephenate dehydratase [Planctomycetia bacterium]
MATKKVPRKNVSDKKVAPGVSEEARLRSELKRLDREVLEAVNRRAALARQIGQLQHAAGEPPFVAAQDDDTLANAAQQNEGPLPETAVRAIFRELLSGTRALVRPLRVAHLGPLYSYSHLAAMHRFGQSVEYVPVGTIAAVFEEVNQGDAHFGLVPIENSTDGRISDTLDMFTRSPARICGEVELPIHHTLLAMCPRTEIREIYSKPQALSQCRNWLAKHVPAARPVEVTSTSTAAQLAREKPGAAAIASHQAGIHYGLNVLAERIEDNPGNVTRFSVIGKDSAARTGNDKTAMLFQLEDRPGVLAEALGIFKRNRVNLTWIESFPIPGRERAYLFFVEMEGHESDVRVRRATTSLRKKALRLEILGSFAVSPPAE